MKSLETLKEVRNKLKGCELTEEFEHLGVDLAEKWPLLAGVIDGGYGKALDEVILAMTDIRTALVLAKELFDEADGAFEEEFGNTNPWREYHKAEKFLELCARHGLII
jgi:hypothetical protein